MVESVSDIGFSFKNFVVVVPLANLVSLTQSDKINRTPNIPYAYCIFLKVLNPNVVIGALLN